MFKGGAGVDATCWGRVQQARDVLDVRLGRGLSQRHAGTLEGQ